MLSALYLLRCPACRHFLCMPFFQVGHILPAPCQLVIILLLQLCIGRPCLTVTFCQLLCQLQGCQYTYIQRINPFEMTGCFLHSGIQPGCQLLQLPGFVVTAFQLITVSQNSYIHYCCHKHHPLSSASNSFCTASKICWKPSSASASVKVLSLDWNWMLNAIDFLPAAICLP